jgi:phenylacetate-coenzyme A ligase PaaK-like adenylate-forming protein
MRCSSDYQIIQEKEDFFVFRFVPAGKGISESEKAEIVRRIKRGCLGEEVKVEFEEVSEIKRGRTMKRKTVISKVKPNKNL